MDGPQDDDWYLRNRSRDGIAAMIRVIREIQLLSKFKDSDVLKIMGNIYLQTGGTKVGNELKRLGMLMERDERSNRK